MRWLTKQLDRLCVSCSGVTLVEYGIAIALAISVGSAALLALGGEVNNQVDEATNIIN